MSIEQGDRATARLRTVGIYVQPPAAGQEHFLEFYKACGYNYLEFCEGGFGTRPDAIPAYHESLARSIRDAQRKGFRVWILLLAGMRQWKGPGEAGSAGTFSALDKAELTERLGFIRQAVKGLRGADGFEFFAGDPGGDPEGRSTLRDCIGFANEVRRIVREEAPDAGFAVNLWAVAEWAGFPSPFSLNFWRKQAGLSSEAVVAPDLLDRNCGIVFSLDGYYRSLTLACYEDGGAEPDLYPDAGAVSRLRARGVRPILGWPYFLVDECDDGFITPNNVVTKGQAGSEVRYIRAIVDRGRDLGLDGLVANASFVAAEPLNIYAFARMCRSPRLAPETALDDFAAIVAEPRSRAALARVLRFIDSHGNWQNSLPARHRLPNMDCGGLQSADDALALLSGVTPRARARIVLPEPPAQYLERLRKRLEAIRAGDIGGTAPIVR